MVSLSFASLSREGGSGCGHTRVRRELGGFLKQSAGARRSSSVDVSAEPDECLYRLSVYAHDRKLCLVWVDTPAALRVIGWLLEFLVWLGLGGLWAGRNALNRKFYSEKRQCFAISEEPTLFLSLTEDKDYREALMQAEFLDGKLEVVRVGSEFPASFAVCVQRCRDYPMEAAVHLALRLNQGGKVKQQDVSPLYLLDAKGQKTLEKIARQAEWQGRDA